jgi:hypothetical protein
MTRKVRKQFLLSALGLCILIFLINAGTLVYFLLIRGTDMSAYLAGLAEFGIADAPSLSVTSLLLQSAFVPGAILSTYLYFRKTPSPEVFFFVFALVSFSLESLRLTAPLVEALTAAHTSLIPLTRLVYFSRVMSILSLFASGLFATGLTYQRQEIYLGGFVLISFTLATALPIDFTSFDLPFLLEAGEETGLSIAYYTIAAIAVLNFLYAAYIHNNGNYLLNALALVLFIGAKEIFFYYPNTWYALPALLGLIAGTLLFAQRTHEIYLWL